MVCIICNTARRKKFPQFQVYLGSMGSMSKWIISANLLRFSKKQHLNDKNNSQFLLEKNLQMYQQIPNQSESLVCREETKGREFITRKDWPGDPGGDLRRKICGLSVHMVTGVCRISNPIQPASLFSITISVKKRGRCTHDGPKLKDWQPTS